MSKVAEKDLYTVRRRVASVTNHLIPVHSVPSCGSVDLVKASSNDSYRRKHGEVSGQPVVWRAAFDESGKDFTDIIYEKADGEAIAKVRFLYEIKLFLKIVEYLLTFMKVSFVRLRLIGRREEMPFVP